MADGTNFDIAIAASAKTDALKTVRADVDALKNLPASAAENQPAKPRSRYD